MARKYQIGLSQDRVRYRRGGNDNQPYNVLPPADVDLIKGDLLFKNGSNQPVPGSELGTFASAAAARQAAHQNFIGPCVNDYITSQETGQPMISGGNTGLEYDLDQEAAILTGELLGVHTIEETPGNFVIVDFVLTPVANVNESIGRARARQIGGTVSKVILFPVSSVIDSGVQNIVT